MYVQFIKKVKHNSVIVIITASLASGIGSVMKYKVLHRALTQWWVQLSKF